jgi:CubicO group peptidase (beta-lactamase class C family)
MLFAAVPGSLRADPIDDYVTAEMARQNVPGMAIAIMRNGHVVRAQGYGTANLEHSVPVHPDTLFKTGAVGMQFTAIGVMLLVEDGKVRLDDSIREYLPDTPRSWQPITVRQLLNHTSGLPATPNGDFRADYTEGELLAIISGQELNFPAGSRWRFSYADYIVLGFLIKKVSGEYYADFLTKRVFAPLGMRTAQAIDELAVIPNRAAGYELRDGELRNAEWVSPTANSTADGSLYLSALDYAAWEAALADRKILTPESWAEIARPARIASGRDYPYGFGWFQGPSAGQQTWRHSGSWQGFQTFMIHYLGDELTVVALANSDSGDPARIAHRVAAMMDPKFAQAPAVPINEREPDVTERLRNLLGRIAEGQTAYEDFAYFAKLDFTELMASHRALLNSMGSLRELALFAREERGDDRVYRYRARFDGGLLEVSLGYAPNGKIGSLDIIPIGEWDEPLQN